MEGVALQAHTLVVFAKCHSLKQVRYPTEERGSLDYGSIEYRIPNFK